MKRKFLSLFTVLSIVGLLITSVGTVSAQEEELSALPDCPPYNPSLVKDQKLLQTLPVECLKAYKAELKKNSLQREMQNAVPSAIGGPDGFGYIYDDAVSYNWISATTNSGLTGDDNFSGPINIGFSFPFYGFTQTQLYLSTNGLITFGAAYQWYGGDPIPLASAPNNFIAPFWEDLVVGSSYNSGAIYTMQGGSAPNRYFVLEWRNVETWSGSSPFSFEAILYENGDIVVQHQSLPASYYSTVGIENSFGDDGLQYQAGSGGLSAPKAIRFYYPAPSARAWISPVNAGKFSALGGITNFTITVTNTGSLGMDTYDLTASSSWSFTLYAANGTTPLSDTDGDAVVDTGPMSQGSSVNIVAKFNTPGGAQTGNYNAATVTATSSLNVSKAKTANLRMSIPAGFANVFADNDDGAMSLIVVNDVGTNTYKATANYYSGYNVAVARLANGNYLYTWNMSAYTGTFFVNDVEYAILDRNGSLIQGATKLTDNSSAAMSTFDSSPSMAVAPNGTVGVVWARSVYNSSSQANFNIYLATLDGSGNLLTGPTNVTNNAVWGTYSALNIPRFYRPAIASTDDNSFILGWEDDRRVGPSSWQYNISYAGRNTSGTSVFAPTALTSDNQSWGSVLNSLSGGKAILTWLTSSGGPYYAVINSNGSIAKTATSLGSGTIYWSPDSVLLPNGKVAVAWATSTGVQFSILNSSYNIESGPTSADSPSLAQGEALSVTTDLSSHVIMSWANGSTSEQNLLYALGDSAGGFITPPMFYKTSGSYFDPSWNGQGIARYDTRVISGNAGVAGVTLSYTDGTPKTVTSSANGSYSFAVLSGWSGVVMPSHSCYNFSPTSRTYNNITNSQITQNYTATIKPGSGCANIDVVIGGATQGTYGVPPQGSQRVTYALDIGPAKVESTNSVPIIAALRDAWLSNGQVTSFSQLMGLPKEQLSDTYYLPAYNNVTLSGQLRFGNVDTMATDVTVKIGGVPRGTYHLNPTESIRLVYNLDTGPVEIKSSNGAKIIVALRDAWLVNGQVTSFTQLMGLPKEQLSDTYYLPAYNNVTLSGQLRFGNVDTIATDVTVKIGGIDRGTYHLNPNESTRQVYNLDTGPVEIKSSNGAKIIVALRDAWLVNGQVRSFAQLMGLPKEKLSDTYYLPAYNNVTLSGQLRFGNVDSVATDVTVTIGGAVQNGGVGYHLNPNESTRQVYNLDTGPVEIKSSGGVKIIAALRDAWLSNGQVMSFVQLMGLPKEALSTTYWFPAYNNVTLSGQLRFGVP